MKTKVECICKYCYRIFEPARARRGKYCKRACRQAAYRSRQLALKLGR